LVKSRKEQSSESAKCIVRFEEYKKKNKTVVLELRLRCDKLAGDVLKEEQEAEAGLNKIREMGWLPRKIE
jgi:hypothetical protein